MSYDIDPTLQALADYLATDSAAAARYAWSDPLAGQRDFELAPYIDGRLAAVHEAGYEIADLLPPEHPGNMFGGKKRSPFEGIIDPPEYQA